MPVFQSYDSFYRLVVKACAPNRDDRFVSADELRSQMIGVLREVVALDRGSAPRRRRSPRSSSTSDAGHRARRLAQPAVPAPRPARCDGRLAPDGQREPGERLERLMSPASRRPGAARAGPHGSRRRQRDVAETTASELLQADPWEWRAVWIQGLAALGAG